MSLKKNASFEKTTLKRAGWYWESIAYKDIGQEHLSYSFSGDSVYGHSTLRPQTFVASYYTTMNHLVDVLSRREFLYRQYLETSLNNFYLPLEMTASPENPLLLEVKQNLLYIDPATYLSENSRNIVYLKLGQTKFVYFKNILNYLNTLYNHTPLNLNFINSYLLFYFYGSHQNEIGKNEEFYKNQFRPLRKGITSLLRLHATGAIALPIEVRLQILASSRDVIHSWSIPSAGIKIDCVPGYTSHKIMVFLLSGIY
jgi:hypothetical protein